MDTLELVNFFTAAFVTFFVLIDAVGVAPVFASLTAPDGAGHARRMAIKSVFVAACIITGFALGGAWLFDHMGISLDAFRAAGGVLLFLIALDMVFEKRTERREHRAEEILAEDHAADDVSVFPLGIPMIAGPGTIATAMLYMQKADGEFALQAATMAAIFANLVLCLLIFLLAGPLLRVLGPSVAGAVTRILGVILAALSVQLLFDGVKGAFGLA